MCKKSCPILAAILLAISLTPLAIAADTETTLHAFNTQDGVIPNTALISDGAGNLYGATTQDGPQGAGTVYELSPNGSGGWNFNVVYAFTGGVDGNQPIDRAGLTFDSQGNLYGTCAFGGNSNNGTVFELSKVSGVWTLTNYYDFSGFNDGATPVGGVALDSAGNIYGTTVLGANGYGTVFELTPSSNGWIETTLHTFTGGNDGANSWATPAFDRAGNLYATATAGGTYNQGVVFKLTKSGSSWIETVLYTFTGAQSDGSTPGSNVSFDREGRLYSTTLYTTGNGAGNGGVFRLTPSPSAPRTVEQPWQITWLYQFVGTPDGSVPNGLILDSAGNLYGDTNMGGQNGQGEVFQLSPNGSGWIETSLYSFDFRGDDGGNPNSNLYMDSSGNLYGTTQSWGAYGYGTVFELTQ